MGLFYSFKIYFLAWLELGEGWTMWILKIIMLIIPLLSDYYAAYIFREGIKSTLKKEQVGELGNRWEEMSRKIFSKILLGVLYLGGELSIY